MSAVLSVISREYIKVPVNVKKNGVYVDPTDTIASMAFIDTKTDMPGDTDWTVSSWESGLGHKYYIRCLVGLDGDIELAAGIYWVWIKIEDAPETPIRQVGNVRIIGVIA